MMEEWPVGNSTAKTNNKGDSNSTQQVDYRERVIETYEKAADQLFNNKTQL